MALGIDWTQDEAYKQYLASVTAGQPGAGPQAAPAGSASSRKKKRRSQQTAAPTLAAPQTTTGQQYNPGSQGGLSGAQTTTRSNPGGMGGVSTGGVQTAADPKSYGTAVDKNVLNAPAGSLASRVSSTVRNPEAMEMTAINPGIQADLMLGEEYGLPAGSRTSGMLSTYLNPQDKALALLGEQPGTNVDWINFGEQLMGSSALSGMGAQLNPRTMMQTLVSTVLNETKAMAKGGSGVGSGEYNPLAELARANPAQGVEQFVSMVRGALTGTMPGDQLEGYVGWLKRIGMQFATEFVQGDAAQMESQGVNWMSALVQKLGPTLGL